MTRIRVYGDASVLAKEVTVHLSFPLTRLVIDDAEARIEAIASWVAALAWGMATGVEARASGKVLWRAAWQELEVCCVDRRNILLVSRHGPARLRSYRSGQLSRVTEAMSSRGVEFVRVKRVGHAWELP